MSDSYSNGGFMYRKDAFGHIEVTNLSTGETADGFSEENANENLARAARMRQKSREDNDAFKERQDDETRGERHQDRQTLAITEDYVSNHNIVSRPKSKLPKDHAPGNIIDCDADPYIPEPFTGVKVHVKGGIWEWDSNIVQLPRFPLRQAWMLLNANVLDWLLTHQSRIPAYWKDRGSVIFGGTTYVMSGRLMFVREMTCGYSATWSYREVDVSGLYRNASAAAKRKP